MRSQGVNPLESAEERFRSLLSDNSWGRVSKGAEEIFKRLSGISAKDIASSSPIDGKTTFSQFGSLVNTQMQVSSPVKIEFDDAMLEGEPLPTEVSIGDTLPTWHECPP